MLCLLILDGIAFSPTFWKVIIWIIVGFWQDNSNWWLAVAYYSPFYLFKLFWNCFTICIAMNRLRTIRFVIFQFISWVVIMKIASARWTGTRPNIDKWIQNLHCWFFWHETSSMYMNDGCTITEFLFLSGLSFDIIEMHY